MDLLEHQGKELFERHGIKLIPRAVAASAAEAREAAGRLGPVAVKVQVQAGGRGKGGGIVLAKTPDEAEPAARKMFEDGFNGMTVTRVLLERLVDIERELYMAVTLDRAEQRYVAMTSSEGGIDIEEVAATRPEAIRRAAIDPLLGLKPFHVRRLVGGFPEDARDGAGALLERIYEVLITNDATLVEVNPLAVLKDGRVVPLDAKVTIDDNALYRHPDLAEYASAFPLEPTEARARELGLQFVKLDGQVGIIGNGAGLVMSTLDVVQQAGGAAANFLDVGGGAGADVMAVLLEADTPVVVQGITGKEGRFHTLRNRDYGTNVVAGVTPGKAGEDVEGVPVFDSVAEAVEATGADASITFVPARFAADAILEAADAGVSLIVCITEGIPVLDMARVANYLRGKEHVLIGPNCPGLISPGKANLGIIPGEITKEGGVGLVSRSGTLTYQIMNELTQRGIGQSTCIGIGGDPIIGTGFVDVLARFEADPQTEAVVLIGEIGGSGEADAPRDNTPRPTTAAGPLDPTAGAVLRAGALAPSFVHRVPVEMLLVDTSGPGALFGGAVEVGFTVRVALLLATAGAGWLLVRGGRAAGGSLGGPLVAAPYAALSVASALLADGSDPAILLGAGFADPGQAAAHPSLWWSALAPGAIALAGGLAAGLASSRDAARSVWAAAAGAWRMSWMLAAGGTAGILVVVALHPNATRAFLDSAGGRGRGGGAAAGALSAPFALPLASLASVGSGFPGPRGGALGEGGVARGPPLVPTFL